VERGAMKTPLWIAALAVCVAVPLYVEWHTDEVTVVLAVLVLFAAVLGAARPPLAPVAGALLGFSVLAAHAVTEAAGTLRPRYLHSAIATGDWAAMALAGVAITAVAWGAGIIRSRVIDG
jgi:hypothetical protein